MLMYHGSPKAFDNFDLNKSHGMIWLTSNIEYAKQFGEPHPVNVSVANYLDATEFTGEYALERWQDILSDLGVDINLIDWEKADFAPDYGYYWWYDLLPHDGNNYRDSGTIFALKNAGYDAILAPEEFSEGIGSETTVVLLTEELLK